MPTRTLQPTARGAAGGFRTAFRGAILAFLGTAALAGPARASDVPPVACDSPATLYSLLNAADERDRIGTAQLSGAACQPLAGLHFELVAERDGLVTIRIFPRPGDWASSRLAFTLDEMVTPDDLPGSPTPPPAGPSS